MVVIGIRQINPFLDKNEPEAPGGVEPSTFRLLGGRSNQLSYRACVASSNDYTFQLVCRQNHSNGGVKLESFDRQISRHGKH